MYTNFKHPFIIALILLNTWIPNTNSETTNQFQAPENTIDLTGSNAGQCIQSFPFYLDPDNQIDQGRTQRQMLTGNPHLTVNLPRNSECVEMHQTYGCNEQQTENENGPGAYLQLLNVKGHRRTVSLNSGGVEPTRLLNFNLSPNSFRSCDDSQKDDQKLRKELCQSSFRLEITGTLQKTLPVNDNSCVDVPKPIRKDSTKPVRTQAEIFVVREHPKDGSGTVCLELFSESGCTGNGNVARFVLPFSSTLWNREWNTVKIWEYFSDRQGNPVVDIDINSVRKCSYCRQQQDTTTEEEFISISNYAAVSNRQSDGPTGEESNYNCNFYKCVKISLLIPDSFSTSLDVPWDCYFFFNDTKHQCSMQPIIQESHLNVSLLSEIAEKNPSFKDWSVAECRDHGEIDHHCLVPMWPGKGIKDAFKKTKKMTKCEDEETTEFNSGSFGVTIFLILLFVLLIMSVLLWRMKRGKPT